MISKRHYRRLKGALQACLTSPLQQLGVIKMQQQCSFTADIVGTERLVRKKTEMTISPTFLYLKLKVSFHRVMLITREQATQMKM